MTGLAAGALLATRQEPLSPRERGWGEGTSGARGLKLAGNVQYALGDLLATQRTSTAPGSRPSPPAPLPGGEGSTRRHRSALVAALLLIAPPAFANDLLDDCNAAAHARTLVVAAASEPAHVQAIWLDAAHLRWPRMPADGHYRLYQSNTAQLIATPGSRVSGADNTLPLSPIDAAPAASLAAFPHLAAGVDLALGPIEREKLDALLRGQWLLVREDADGRVLDATRTQHAGLFDALYAAAAESTTLGAQPNADRASFALWAPSAQAVAVCLYDSDASAAKRVEPLQRDDASGAWRSGFDRIAAGSYYTFLVDIVVPGVGLIRNRVTDPYAVSLGTDSKRAWLGDLDAPDLQPKGWQQAPRPAPLAAATDMQIYELHVRDFSRDDPSVAAEHRGKYLAFTQHDSLGMRQLAVLANAGLTDIHLLPVFDLASIPESGCVTPSAAGAPDSEAQQAAVAEAKDRDCYNWGYDPQHYSAPEGSYASDPADGAVRVREFRSMVMALHARGLRVGMDVVYNHTSHSGQHERSVLDRIVPGYYHRLDADGRVETSTCCDNTATERRMMAKLMIDSVLRWARDYRIDSFRFDLMGHQPRAVMEQLQREVDRAAGRHIELIGEGWNFGEVADGGRFVQASQLSLSGSGIATFSDRARDAVRGGGAADSGDALLTRQGYINGLHYAPNAHTAGLHDREELLRAADMVRVGLAGSLRDYRLQTHDGSTLPLAQIDYAGQPAGYVSAPGEVVNYVENHDNPTLFDINALRLPRDTTAMERARVQILGNAIVAFSQGIAYYHAGTELLRSKSLDRNSYDSGDHFNRLDWTLTDNGFGAGLPPAWDNEPSWPAMRPLLADPTIKPGPAEIAWTRSAFLDLLRIRASSTLFRLRSADDVQARLRFHNTGPQQVGTVLAAQIDGTDYPGARFASLLYFINVGLGTETLQLPETIGQAFELHPVHRAKDAADRRPVEQSTFDAVTGTITLPARTALVYVLEQVPRDRPPL
jgi:pullulanase